MTIIVLVWFGAIVNEVCRLCLKCGLRCSQLSWKFRSLSYGVKIGVVKIRLSDYLSDSW